MCNINEKVKNAAPLEFLLQFGYVSYFLTAPQEIESANISGGIYTLLGLSLFDGRVDFCTKFMEFTTCSAVM